MALARKLATPVKTINGPPRASARVSRPRTVTVMNFFGLFNKKPQGQASPSGDWKPSEDGAPRRLSRSGYDVTPLTPSEKQKAAEGLNDFQKYVTLEHGTERPFTGKTVNGYDGSNKQRGVYVSAIGDLPLFTSETKFDSGTGWPSFYAPLDPEHIIEKVDRSIPFMPRVEVLDAKSGAHLGHVFDDGPRPTGKRYCINAAALKFVPESEFKNSGAEEKK